LLKKDKTEIEYINREIDLHASLKHPNIIQLQHIFETDTHTYLFLEYAENGDLFEYIRKNKPNRKLLLKCFYETC